MGVASHVGVGGGDGEEGLTPSGVGELRLLGLVVHHWPDISRGVGSTPATAAKIAHEVGWTVSAETKRVG